MLFCAHLGIGATRQSRLNTTVAFEHTLDPLLQDAQWTQHLDGGAAPVRYQSLSYQTAGFVECARRLV